MGRGKRRDPLFPFPSSPARFSFPSPQPRFELYVLMYGASDGVRYLVVVGLLRKQAFL